MKSKTNSFVRKKIWPMLVSAGSALIIVVAYFIPSIQDQWDRYESRQIIQQYVAMGDDFIKEEKYTLAEQAFTRAFELSEQHRLDIDIKRLRAKVSQIYVDLSYGVTKPDSLAEVDIQYLLHMLHGEENRLERADVLTIYSLYLTSVKRIKEGEKTILEAIELNPNDSFAFVSLGNIVYEAGKKEEARKAYEKAIRLAPSNFDAHYYLAHLLLEEKKSQEATSEFKKALAIDPNDIDSKHQIDSLENLP